MPAYFWDTSALVKCYFDEVGSETANAIFSDRASIHHVCSLARVETVSAIMRRAANATEKLEAFEQDSIIQLQELRLDDELFDASVRLVRQHRLRGCDSLHLSCALRLARLMLEFNEPLLFVCADDELNRAATAEGLQIINPL